MTERNEQNREIQIKRVVEELSHLGTQTVATVPITPKCVRKFSLMQEDYIQLEFSLPSAVHIAIGDYFDDDLFGRFVCTGEQMPKFNSKTGGYDYSLHFDADYMVWKNWVHCMTVIADGVKQRMETEWGLTDQLLTHAQQIADEVNLIIGEQQASVVLPGDPITSDGYCVDVTAEKRKEIHYISYNGTDIISAMNMIAEAWQCEWWVTREQKEVDGVLYSKVIHFGKCENAGTGYDFRLGDNVESMDINRDQQSYANRIFAFGGTKNVPEDYDRKLEFVVTDAGEALPSKYWVLSNHRLNIDMIPDTVNGLTTVIPNNIEENSSWEKDILGNGGFIVKTKKDVAPDTYFLSGNVTPSFTLPTSQRNGILSVTFKIYLNGVEIASEKFNSNEAGENLALQTTTWSTTMAVNTSLRLEQLGRIQFAVDIIVRNSANYDGVYNLAIGSMKAYGSRNTEAKNIVIEFDGEEYNAILNENHYNKYNIEANKISNIRKGNTYAMNEGFGLASIFTVKEDYLDFDKVPNSYYTPIYETGVLSKVGEKRIHMPNNRYVQAAGLVNTSQVVEQVVLFDDIFPKMNLKITSVRTEPKVEDITYADGSVERQNWNQYIFKACKANNNAAFEFLKKYIMDGNKLQAVFTAPDQMYESGFMLAGMTFDVGFDNLTQEYTIIRNEDYGAKFPNDLVYPQIDDTFFLTGWNPKSIRAMSLVSDAEDEVEKAARDYLNALQEGNFTFNCRMMSGWFFDLEADRFLVLPEELVDDEEEEEEEQQEEVSYEPFFTVDDNAFYVGNGFTRYRLPQAGDIVTVYHDALKDGSKTSRIIGYEFKLDKPYDTPTYVVGETEAFSRLKQIEKQLTKR